MTLHRLNVTQLGIYRHGECLGFLSYVDIRLTVGPTAWLIDRGMLRVHGPGARRLAIETRQ